MQNINLNTLFRTSVGFDRINSILEGASSHADLGLTYPPHNIIKDSENEYRIIFALAGFSIEELDVTLENNTLTIKSIKKKESDVNKFIYRGISRRGFKRSFQLADFMEVVRANMHNGLLEISLKREIPQALQPKTIKILQEHKITNKAA
ncbi:MAG: Hsp20 family protein [Pseudomonadota bacterium]|nr:Hsp20 family protein [Pseudomonadota bacterium]